MTEKEPSTEEKILQSASKVFTEKGFSGTRTRDIAEEAGINLALLNYYFRSKEKLFEQVMKIKVLQMFGSILPIIINEKTTLEEKIDHLSQKYLDTLSQNPNLPIFVMSEIQKNPNFIPFNLPSNILFNNISLFKQIKEKKPELNPLHFMISFLGMTVFPFVAKPVTQKLSLLKDQDFKNFIEERRQLIPIWMKTILNN